ncbi:hypothetical protein [Nocardia jiangsuensis]|uniref:Uncharacterized protein n=1 Tax=Nocardia jiangsuensis TaxID=1691563 RepID=A0ABV8DTY5_9NOCA
MAPNEPSKPAELGLPDLTGKKEGDTWTTRENGVDVTYTIPVGNGTNSVDRSWTNSDGGTSTNRLAGDGAGGLQSWTDSTSGPSIYANKESNGTTDGIYGYVYDPGSSTTGAPDVVFGGNPNLTTVEATRLDADGNPVALLGSSRNSRGNWDSMGVDNQGNRTLFGDLPDGRGGFLPGSLVGQIDPGGYGWSTDTTGTRWNIAPDPSGDPGALLRWRTDTTPGGDPLAIYIDSNGVEKREVRDKDSNAVRTVEYFDLDGTRTHFDTEADTKSTFDPHDRTLTVVEKSGETTVFDDGGKVLEHTIAPGTVDVPGLIDKAIDAVYFWNPLQRGAGKAAAHTLVGFGGLLGWYDDHGRALNLPTQHETLSSYGDMGRQMALDYLYLQGNQRDEHGNTIWSPDGKLDPTHALLNSYNNLSMLTIGVDWNEFEDKPGETIGAALFGIGTFFVPGPKGLSALARGARFGGIVDDLGHFGVTPHYPDLDLPEIDGRPNPHIDGAVPPAQYSPFGRPHTDPPGGEIFPPDAPRGLHSRPGPRRSNQVPRRAPGEHSDMFYNRRRSGDVPLGAESWWPNVRLPENHAEWGRRLETATPPRSPAGMEPIKPDHSNRWNDSWFAGPLFSSMKGKIGDALTRAKIQLDGYTIVATGDQISILVPGLKGGFKPDFLARDPEGNLVMIESKSWGAGYTDAQLPGYTHYRGGDQILDFGEDEFLNRRLRALGFDEPSNVVVDRVETVRWNGPDGYVPTDEVLRKAAMEFEENYGPFTRKPKDHSSVPLELTRSKLLAWGELVNELARRDEASGRIARAMFARAKQAATELVLNATGRVRPDPMEISAATRVPVHSPFSESPVQTTRRVSVSLFKRREVNRSLTVNVIPRIGMLGCSSPAEANVVIALGAHLV